MEALSLFAILVLAGAIIVLLYYYMQDVRNSPFSRLQTQRYGAGEASAAGGKMSGMTDKVYGVGEKLKGKVKDVPISTDVFSAKIEAFLDDKSDQLIEDWELATKKDLVDVEKRYSKISRDVDELESRFNEYRGSTNKKIEKIEERLEKLENLQVEKKS
jgi:archaellum component FlaC